MLLDPFTVGAQILNFLILVWLLHRLLYGPITRVMADRDARIQSQMDEARRLHEEATALGERHQALLAAFEEERHARQTVAREEVEAWRHTHLQAVRTEVEALRHRWVQAIAQEKRAFLHELRRRAGREVLAVTRNALRDLADASIEERIVARFLGQLDAVAPQDRDALVAAAEADGHRVHVRTAFTLPEAEQARVTDKIRATLGAGVTAVLERDPGLVGGLELRAGGLTVAWTIDDYLSSLEAALAEAFGQDQQAEDDGDTTGTSAR
jgi:F-type H+-transporting ATPase subunit b